jgi:hypothetical protein
LKFGLDDTYVRFSKPVQIHIPTPDLVDGDTVDLHVQHETETNWTTDSLTTNPDTLCSGGVASEIASTAVVASGSVTFYTCGASTFVVTLRDSVSTIQGMQFDGVDDYIQI